jgi:hypothetical protein
VLTNPWEIKGMGVVRGDGPATKGRAHAAAPRLYPLACEDDVEM